MGDKNLIYKRLVELNENQEQWIDPYDSEDYKNKYIRKLIKVSLYFTPTFLYRINVIKQHIWPENLELIGKCFLKLGEIRRAEQIYLDLINISKGKYYWGLPIDWNSSKYVFPKGSMMSTTTSEIALFFVELKQFSNLVTDEVLRKIAYNLLDGLNRVYEDDNKLILGYTAFDEYRVNNSNLLVAAALHEIGKSISDANLVRSSIKIANACVDGISANGGIPYYMNGCTYDSYHQVFSLRALNLLKNESPEFEDVYNSAISFLKEELMDDYGNVYLTPKKNTIDMQGAAEALSFFKLVKDEDTALKIWRQIENVLKKSGGKYIQRYWRYKFIFSIKSRAIFTRQGELRYLIARLDMLGEYDD